MPSCTVDPNPALYLHYLVVTANTAATDVFLHVLLSFLKTVRRMLYCTIYFGLKYIKRMMNFPRSSSPASYSCQMMMLPHSLFLISPCCGGRRGECIFLLSARDPRGNLSTPSTTNLRVCARAPHSFAPVHLLTSPVTVQVCEAAPGALHLLSWLRGSTSAGEAAFLNIGGAAADKHYNMRLQLLLTPSDRPGKGGEGGHWERSSHISTERSGVTWKHGSRL